MKDHYCPVHGPVGAINIIYDGKLLAAYCFLCAAEKLEQLGITKVTWLQPPAEDAGTPAVLAGRSATM